MRIFKIRGLAKFARQERITDASLTEAILRADRGSIDADLGGGVTKQRVARQGQVAYRAQDRAQERAVFLFGFAKNERENITANELLTLREIAADLLGADDARISHAIEEGVLLEIAL